MNVLHVVPSGGTNPSSMIFSKRERDAIAAMGVDVSLFGLSSRTSPFALIKDLFKIRKTINQDKPAVVHAQFGTVTGLFSSIACLGTKSRCVITFRGSDLNPSPRSPRVRAFIGRAFSKVGAALADHVICVSEQLKDRVQSYSKKIAVIPTGVDTNIFYPVNREEARARLNLPSDVNIVLFNAGGRPREKRLDIAQDAVERAGNVVGNVRLLLLNGNVSPELVPMYIGASDCVLLVSDWEGSPTIVQEAMACNIPVVTFDVGDVRERLAGVVPSMIVPRDPSAVADAIVEIMLGPRVSNGRESAKHISHERLALDIIRVYEDAIKWPRR